MHTFKGNRGTTFHYNADLSGKVIITRPFGNGLIETIEVPAADIADFVKNLFDQLLEMAREASEDERLP